MFSYPQCLQGVCMKLLLRHSGELSEITLKSTLKWRHTSEDKGFKKVCTNEKSTYLVYGNLTCFV